MNSRPGSAKTQFTKVTEDSDHSKPELNVSKFSETYSSGSTSFFDKPDQFREYVKKKNEDPKFRHLKPKLDVIEEKSKGEGKKPSFKPFQRKKVNQKSVKKEDAERDSMDDSMKLSKGFAKKNNAQLKKNSNLVGQAVNQIVNKKVSDVDANYGSWKVNKPGVKKDPRKQMKIQMRKTGRMQGGKSQISPKKQPEKQERTKKQEKAQKVEGRQKTEAEIERQDEMKSLQQFVNNAEAQHLGSFTSQYERMIHENPSNVEDLEKIDINDFMEDPTEEGYELMIGKIQAYDRKLGTEIEEESIDLEQLIRTEGQESRMQTQHEQEDYLDSMSASDLKKRNMFITEILTGQKISKKNLNELEETERGGMRMHRLQREKEQKQDDDDLELPEINMMKRHSNRMIEMNKVQAGGHVYRDCDYLSEEHQRRIEELLGGDIGESPFDCDDLERMKRRRVDQGIRMYREMSNAQEIQEIFNQESLPKDPQNRKNAEKRILNDKIKSVNERLSQVDKVPATKQKVKSLVEQFQFTKHSQSYDQLCQDSKQRLEETLQKLQEAGNLLHRLQDKQNINQVINDIEEQYRELESEIKRYAEIDAQKWKEMEQARLKRKMKEVEEMQRENWQMESEITKMEDIKNQVQEKLRALDELEMVEIPQFRCQGFTPLQTLDDIDLVITRKLEQGEPIKDASEDETQS